MPSKNDDTKCELQVWVVMKSHYELIVQFLVINFCEFMQIFYDKMSVRSAICMKTLLHFEIKTLQCCRWKLFNSSHTRYNVWDNVYIL